MTQSPPASPALARPTSILDRIGVRRWEFWLVVALTVFGGALRLINLTGLPAGFHGDEANVALDADRILREGWIGPWSGRANGYPIAINYMVAGSIKMLGHSVFASRLPMSLLGIAAIPLIYAVTRNIAGWRPALCATLLLILSLWHLHLSRVSFPVIGWGTAELAALFCLQMGLKHRRWWWFVGCGLSTGLSLWIYNSAFVFAAALGLWLAVWMAVRLWRRRDMNTLRDLVLLAIFAASALFAAKPILDYQRKPNSDYNDRFSAVYLFSAQRRAACNAVAPANRDTRCKDVVRDSLTGRIDVTSHHLYNLWDDLTTVAAPDAADGLGAAPPLGRLAAYLAVVGAIIALLRYPTKPPIIIGLITIPILAVSTALTVDGQYRRTFGMMPFLAIYGGIALGTLWEWADRQRIALLLPAIMIVWASIGWIGYKTLDFYFGGGFQDNVNTRFVFSPDVTEAYSYLNTAGHPYVYFWNNRASLNYETRLILARDIAGGEDRSSQFTTEDNKGSSRYDLAPEKRPIQPITRDPDGAVFLFLGSYANDIEQVKQRYPGGQVTEKFNEQWKRWDFRAYYLPKDLLDRYLAQEHVAYPLPVQPPT